MPDAPYILIVEDDTEISELVQLNLQDQGYRTEISAEGDEAYQKIVTGRYDLIILDLMLPGTDGLEICKRMRADNDDTPLLMLTAKSEEFDKVLGLELGADDYLTKPFSIRELLARVKALLRRARQPSKKNDRDKNTDRLEIGQLVIEPDKHKVRIGGRDVEVTVKEFELLLQFARNPGHAFSRQELLNKVWGYQFDGYEHTVNTHINRLRSKIEEDPSNPVYLKTVWGVGYRFAEPEEIEES
ncbi:MAG: response regulator transcription factor [Balneolaceae bacterium]|nr:response regulator transcription factor [Balneolaceae bacterium]